MIRPKRHLIALALLTGFVMSTSFFSYVAAQTAPSLSDEHRDRIRLNCTSAQARLDRLHASDALLRVDRGQVYESISTKLMATFNSRVSLNRLDAGDLISVAATYERQLGSFRQAYQQYEQTLSRALKVDCREQPEEFYALVEESRAKRQDVSSAARQLHTLINQYGDAFENFAARIEEGRQ